VLSADKTQDPVLFIHTVTHPPPKFPTESVHPPEPAKPGHAVICDQLV